VSIRDCVALGNGSSGLHRVAVRPTRNDVAALAADTLLNNTAVANSGDGFLVTNLEQAPRYVSHNVSAFNLGAGFRTPSFAGSLARNDSWINYGGGYLYLPWPADSNLTADPRFCSLVNGDLSLQANSPCAPAGPFGLIGALPVGCPGTASAPPSAVALELSLSPNPARGHVEFALPARAGAGRLEVLDLLGRVRWRRVVSATDVRVAWDGDGEAGALAPGLYWVRLVAASRTWSKRLVWMR
jgi:hypothetical protein